MGACCDPGPSAADNPHRMGTMSIQLVLVFAATCFAGTLMFLQGISVNLLDRRPSRCRSCGGIRSRTCTCDRDG
jgi:hypothetical protein